MKPKEYVEQLAAVFQGLFEYDAKDGDHRDANGNHKDFPLLAMRPFEELRKLGMIQTVNDKTFIHLQPEDEVYRLGASEPMTQDEFVEYTAGLKQPEKPSGFFSGIREWFHKNIHPLRDFSKYDTQMKQYEIKKYDLCKDAGFDVSGKTEEIERYKAELAADAEKRLDDAAKKIQKNCGLADVDQLIGAFKKAAKADPEVGEYLIEALPKQNLSTCTDLQWDMARSGVVIGDNKNPTKDSEMHIGEDLTFMRVCKRFLPKMLQDRVEVKYAEAQEPYRKMNELMRGNTLSEAEKSELYKNWQSGEFEKAYWADKNALKVEETAEKKPNEMNADERLENGVKGRERLDQAYIEETAAKLGTDEQTVRQVFEAAKGGDDVEMNVEDLFEQPQQEQPQMNIPGQS